MWYWRGGLDVSPAGRSRVQFPVQAALSLRSCHVLPVGRLPINSFHLLFQTSQAEVNVSWGWMFIDVPGWTGCLSKLCPASPPPRAGIGSSQPAALSADQAGMNGWKRDPMIFVRAEHKPPVVDWMWLNVADRMFTSLNPKFFLFFFEWVNSFQMFSMGSFPQWNFCSWKWFCLVPWGWS